MVDSDSARSDVVDSDSARSDVVDSDSVQLGHRGLRLSGDLRRPPLLVLPHAPRDQGEDQHSDHDPEDRLVPRGGRVDAVDVAAREVADRDPDCDPQRRPERVERHELRPVHAGDPGDDPVGLAQPLDEPGDHDHLAAVAVEEVGGLVEPLGRQEDVFPEPLRERAAAEVPDREPDVVAEDRGQEPDQADEPDVEPSGPGVHGRDDQHRLAGHRDAEVLEEDQPEREVAEAVQRRLQAVEDARQVLWGSGGR